MTDLNVRADSVDVEQIMGQIRARIQEKRGADYTEAEIRELAHVQLEKFIDPQGVRSDLVDQFRRRNAAALASKSGELNEEEAIGSGRPGFGWFRWLIRRVFARTIKMYVEVNLRAREELYFEVMHNLVVEVTRLGIEARNAKMRVESLSSRLDFDERRGRSLEEVVQYRPGALERPQEKTDRPDRPNRDNRDVRNTRDNRQQRSPQQQRPPNPLASSNQPSVATSQPGPPTQPSVSSQPVAAGPLGQPGVPNHPVTSDQPNSSGQPGGDHAAGEGGEHRRRRRRRRRRPGQTMADTGGAATAAATPSFAPASNAAPAPARAPEDGGADGQ